MVSHHVILAGFHFGQWCADAIQELYRDVGFFDLGAVEQHCAFAHFHRVTGDSNHPLDVGFRSIAGIKKDDHITALDVLNAKAVGKLVDENPFLITQGRHHGGAFHLDGLIQEEDDRYGDEDTQHKVAKEKPWR